MNLKKLPHWCITDIFPAFYDFEEIGGDCTNFASQCIYAGSGVMNYTPVMGWYYNSPYDRTPSWSGVEYLYNFLITNKSVGPYAKFVPASQVLPGDIVQLGTGSGDFYLRSRYFGWCLPRRDCFPWQREIL